MVDERTWMISKGSKQHISSEWMMDWATVAAQSVMLIG